MLSKVTLFCFAASYVVALALELWFLLRPRPVLRLVSLIFGSAGLLAQTIYLLVQQPTISAQYGWMLALAWILAVFYLYGSLHHRKWAWGLFVLPLILILVTLAALFSPSFNKNAPQEQGWFSFGDVRFLSAAHITLTLLAAVGVCIGFLASVMYLVQARRLKAKLLPDEGVPLPNLERLEQMSKRALAWAFPLLTLGLFFGVVLMFRAAERIGAWTDPRVLSAGLLWVVFLILLYVRYNKHTRGRRVAFLTIAAFVLLLITLVLPHMGRGGIG